MPRICGYIASDNSRLDPDRLFADSYSLRPPEAPAIQSCPGERMGVATAADGDFFVTADRRYHCVVDGRVYATPGLKQALPHAAERLSGSERVLATYLALGCEGLRLLEGGFVFAILDTRDESLVLGRDSFGVKTLFYSRTRSGFVFSSSLAAVVKAPWFDRRIGLAGFLEYLACGYVSAPWTIYQDASAVRPGECVMFKDGKVTARHFHILEPKGWEFLDTEGASETQLVDQLDQFALNAVNRRVPPGGDVAAYLSGGLDTSLLCALLKESGRKNVVGYTLGFNGRPHDETAYARTVARHLQIEHQAFDLDRDEAMEILTELPQVYGQPLADISAIPTCIIARKVSRRFDAIYDGQGPDFLFGNFDLRLLYYCHRGIPSFLRQALARLSQLLTRSVFRKWVSPNLDVAELLRQPEFFWIFTRMFKSGDLERLVGEPVYAESFWCHRFIETRKDIPLAERLRLAQFLCYGVSDVLFKAVGAHNASHVDMLCPYLDLEFFNFVQFLPTQYKFRRGYGKYLQKKLLYRKIPEAILKRPKRGFIMDFVEFGVETTRALTDKYLTRRRLRETGLFDADFALRCVEDYYHGDTNMGPKLWTLLMFEMWREKLAITGVAGVKPPDTTVRELTAA